MSKETKVEFVIQVRRGKARVNWPLTHYGLLEDPTDLARGSALALVQLQMAYPQMADRPINLGSKVPLVLKLPDRDGALQPDIALGIQLDGQWKVIDTEELGEEGLTEVMSKAHFVVLELVESIRAI